MAFLLGNTEYRTKMAIRIRTAWRILFGKHKHWVLIHLTEEELINILQDEDFEVGMSYCGLRPYIFKMMIKRAGESIDFTDIVEEKAKFHFEVEERIRKEKMK